VDDAFVVFNACFLYEGGRSAGEAEAATLTSRAVVLHEYDDEDDDELRGRVDVDAFEWLADGVARRGEDDHAVLLMSARRAHRLCIFRAASGGERLGGPRRRITMAVCSRSPSPVGARSRRLISCTWVRLIETVVDNLS
jgi:hypothetical protein